MTIEKEKLLTQEMILAALSRNKKLQKGQSTQQYLHKATHLQVNGRMLTRIDHIAHHVPHLKVLYAYDNRLTSAKPVSGFKSIHTLYLQHNLLEDISVIAPVGRSLVKLYVSFNYLPCINGLQDCVMLEELYVAYQKIPAALQFDELSMNAIKNTLQILDIRSNKIDSLEPFLPLTSLRRLVASDNALKNIEEAAELCAANQHLSRVWFAGNPFVRLQKYRDIIILHTSQIDELDDKQVHPNERTFLLEREKRGSTVARFLKMWRESEGLEEEEEGEEEAEESAKIDVTAETEAIEGPGGGEEVGH